MNTKANPYMVVLILTVLGWCIATMLAGGCSVDTGQLEYEPPTERCSGVSVVTCVANAHPGDAGMD